MVKSKAVAKDHPASPLSSVAGLPRIAICGLGRLGAQLAWRMAAAGVPPVAVASRTPKIAKDLAAAINGPDNCPVAAPSYEEAIAAADIIFLPIREDLLPALATELAGKPGLATGKLFVHSSGAHPAALLAPLRKAGGRTACFHPIQSFGPLSVDAPNPFEGVVVGIEAEGNDFSALSHIARKLGAKPIRLSSDPHARANYHAAAVVASNALVALMDTAITLMGRTGVAPDEARAALMPLVRGTVSNLDGLTPGEALTGPVVRGDAATIALHLKALSDDEELQNIYVGLVGNMIGLAARSGRLDAEKAAKILEAMMDGMGG